VCFALLIISQLKKEMQESCDVFMLQKISLVRTLHRCSRTKTFEASGMKMGYIDDIWPVELQVVKIDG
jgi:hypothetical protein